MSTGAAVLGTLEVRVAAWSDAGRSRSENQDHFLVADLGVARGEGGLLLDPDAGGDQPIGGRAQVGHRGLLAMVADGMGGAAGGRIASHFAVAWTYRELLARLDAAPSALEPPGLVAALRAAIEAANTRVHEQGLRTPEYAGMGSTVTAALVVAGALHLAQIGDSRAYLVREGMAHRITRDQSLVQKLVDAGAITPEQALHSPQANLLLQALGTAPTVEVELTCLAARRGDLLLLCSDGLYRMLPDADIAAAARELADPASLCRALVDTANERGSPDNITVVAARLEGEALPPAAPGEIPAAQPYEPPAG
ncbi:MAG TPA: protein phosphatase 2C domain-containing protein [Longimicrobiales bacterium]